MRIQTPSMIGSPNQSTRYILCRNVRSSRKRRFLNSLERTRLLETAAATPSFTSKLIRISRGSIDQVTLQDCSTIPKLSTLCSFRRQNAEVDGQGIGGDFRRSVRNDAARVSL